MIFTSGKKPFISTLLILLEIQTFQGLLFPKSMPGQDSLPDSLKSDRISIQFSAGQNRYGLFSLQPGRIQMLRHRMWKQVFMVAPINEQFSAMYFGSYDAYLSRSAYGLEYRESSNYIPPLVADYMDYKMGRDRYLPVVTPVLLGFIVYEAVRYSRNFFGQNNDDDEKSLTPREENALAILNNTFPLTADRWFSLYVKTYRDTLFTFTQFRQLVQNLESKSVITSQQSARGIIEYAPSVRPQE
jgi:hypothetical protein